VIDMDVESPKMSGVLPHSIGIPGRTKSKQGNMVDLTQVNNTHRPNSRFGQALDREVQNMLNGDDLEIEQGPEGDDRDGKKGKAQAKHKPLPEQVDALEIALTLAFREHRYRVEEILEEHMESMEVAEQAHCLEVSKLRSENAMLRERLGLAPNVAAPELYQTVALHNVQHQATSGGHNPAKGAGAGQNKASATDGRRTTTTARATSGSNETTRRRATCPPALGSSSCVGCHLARRCKRRSLGNHCLSTTSPRSRTAGATW